MNSMIYNQKELQRVTPPESNFKNNFDWSSYPYNSAYINIEDYLYSTIERYMHKYKKSKIIRSEFKDELRGVVIGNYIEDISILKRKTIEENQSYIIKKMTMNVEFDKELKFDSLFAYSNPKNSKMKKNKTIIMLNGFTSSPEKILGLGQTDYSNEIGKVFLENGYDIVAPFMFNHGERLNNISGLLSLAGSTLEFFEVNKVISIINYLEKEKSLKNNSIGIYGISGGGRIATYAAAIDNRIQSIVLSGIVQDTSISLLDYAGRKNFFVRNDYNIRFHYYLPKAPFYLKYSFDSISELIVPRPLRIECGSADKVLFDYGIESQANKIKDIYLKNKSEKNFSFSIHSGGHESNPLGTLNWFNDNL